MPMPLRNGNGFDGGSGSGMGTTSGGGNGIGIYTFATAITSNNDTIHTASVLIWFCNGIQTYAYKLSICTDRAPVTVSIPMPA